VRDGAGLADGVHDVGHGCGRGFSGLGLGGCVRWGQGWEAGLEALACPCNLLNNPLLKLLLLRLILHVFLLTASHHPPPMATLLWVLTGNGAVFADKRTELGHWECCIPRLDLQGLPVGDQVDLGQP
jgi:hypothetical protein